MAYYSSQSNDFQYQYVNFQIPTTLELQPALCCYEEKRNSVAIPLVYLTPPGASPQRSQSQETAERAVKRPRNSKTNTEDLNSQSCFAVFKVESCASANEFIGPPSMTTIDLKGTCSNSSSKLPREIDHGPTDLPPRPYVGGKDAVSPFKPRTQTPSIPGSALNELPKIEERIARLEDAIQRVLVIRGEEALSRSLVPGLEDYDEDDHSEDNLRA